MNPCPKELLSWKMDRKTQQCYLSLQLWSSGASFMDQDSQITGQLLLAPYCSCQYSLKYPEERGKDCSVLKICSLWCQFKLLTLINNLSWQAGGLCWSLERSSCLILVGIPSYCVACPSQPSTGWGTEQGAGGILGCAEKHEEVLSDHLQTGKGCWVSTVQHAEHLGHSDLP